MVMIADFLTGDQDLSQEFCVWRLTSPGHSAKLLIGKRRTHSRNGFMSSLLSLRKKEESQEDLAVAPTTPLK